MFMCPKAQFLKHPFVVGARQKRYANFQEGIRRTLLLIALPERFATDSIHSASALFEESRVPGQIVVNYMTTVAVKVNSLSTNRSTDENVRK